jgi:rhodanese-related sulfurtransferase
MTSTRLILVFLGLGVAWAAVAGERTEPPEGQVLFEKYGCTNCHGPEGIHPESKYVPVLRGKPGDYLYGNAVAIFSGVSKSGKTHFMHEQFCIGEAQEEGCYPKPTNAELGQITQWLAQGLAQAALPTKKTTPQGLYVTSTEAYERLQELGDQALFVDVRTRAEVAFVGMPTIADANIPYMTVTGFDEWNEEKGTFKLRPNSEFVLRVEELVAERGLSKQSPIFLMCRSGSRSARAAKILHLAGYEEVYTVTDGFEGDKAKAGPRKGERVVNGWKNSGLPWTYKLDREAMYWEL